MTKKKSLDASLSDQPMISSHQPIVQSFSNPSSIFLENSDLHCQELSVDSYESMNQLGITPPPPAKPPRHNDESGSSSSIERFSPPPAKPPRHFSVYKNDDEIEIFTTNES